MLKGYKLPFTILLLQLIGLLAILQINATARLNSFDSWDALFPLVAILLLAPIYDVCFALRASRYWNQPWGWQKALVFIGLAINGFILVATIAMLFGYAIV